MSPRAIALGAAALLGAASACSASNSACFRTCPALAGQWLVAFEPATDPSECRQIRVTVQDGVLVIAQQTSALSAIFDGQELSGTAYDTGQFTLDGLFAPDAGGLGDAFSFRGTFTPSRDGGAGGDALAGTYDATLRRPGPQGTLTCRLLRSYAAARR
ncbi:MAG TPA: hypothetical protein VIG99_23190 [Myxococcaceae bacterium]|jgi:hypothetical protein